MINLKNVKVGEILRIVGKGAPGFAEIGELVVVKEVLQHPGVKVARLQNENQVADFVYQCGAARLEYTGGWQGTGAPPLK